MKRKVRMAKVDEMEFGIELNPITYLRGSTGWTDYEKSTVDYKARVDSPQKLWDEIQTILKTGRTMDRINITILPRR